jgi:hypothetical protein
MKPKNRNISYSERKTSLSSRWLFHNTTSFENLVGIIQNGFRPSIGEGETQIYQVEINELYVLLEVFGYEHKTPDILKFPRCCFCDIPPNLSRIHKKRYGQYSVGLTKQWGINNGISPLFYVAKDTNVHSILAALYAIYSSESKQPVYLDFPIMNIFTEIERLKYFIKPYMDSKSGYKYYDEREWRFIPKYQDQIDYTNPENFLKFERKDLLRINVRKNSEKHEILRLMQKQFGGIKNDVVKVNSR